MHGRAAALPGLPNTKPLFPGSGRPAQPQSAPDAPSCTGLQCGPPAAGAALYQPSARAVCSLGPLRTAGFGLGFERLILFATGLDNIRDVIPFPRWPGNATY